MDTDQRFQNTVKNAFGPSILDANGVIDRTKLGELVFRDANKRRLLNQITHPRIFRRIIAKVLRLKLLQRKPHVVIDAPLLFETKILEYVCYPIIVVYCEDTQIQLKRLTERNNLSEEEAMRKISAQMPINIKVQKADITVENGTTLKDLEKHVIGSVIPQVYQKLGYIDSTV